MSIEAMKLALEALEADEQDMVADKDGHMVFRVDVAITALRQAIEQAEQQEPLEYWSVAEGWVKIDEVREHFDMVGCGTIYKTAGEGRSPLYTAPQKKEWVGLTDEEIAKIIHGNVEDGNMFPYQFAKATEAKLKEKNT